MVDRCVLADGYDALTVLTWHCVRCALHSRPTPVCPRAIARVPRREGPCLASPRFHRNAEYRRANLQQWHACVDHQALLARVEGPARCLHALTLVYARCPCDQPQIDSADLPA